ncbi:MAG: amidophosphoribosyltransferase [Oscillospiraceae bacterium]|nr:amidophosphoribosyltransferase [Oscillospiraceae bacterium]
MRAPEKLHEECGVFGIYDRSHSLDCARLTYYALYALQHRGQESCGIVTHDGNEFICHKSAGLVPEVFNDFTLNRQKGYMAVGHVSFVAHEDSQKMNSQPLVTKYHKGSFAIANNGGLQNHKKLINELVQNGAIFHSDTDAEIISYLMAWARITSSTIENALAEVMKQLVGAYSLVIMTPRKLIAARDPYGIRPLCIGRLDDAWIFASETAALKAVGAEYVRDVEPGEIVIVTEEGLTSKTDFVGRHKPHPCIFEYIYFARPDSSLGGQSVYEARREAGAILGRETRVDADIVIGVPDSGLCAAVGYSEASGIPYGIGIVKNRYVGRTFIQPGKDERRKNVEIKLTALESGIKDKRVVLVDDSIIRGTTCASLIKLLKDAGASEVHMRVSSPPFLWPCFYGTDIPNKHELAANNLTCEELRQKIGADSLGYLDVEDLKKIVPNLSGYCDACFSGKYPTEE